MEGGRSSILAMGTLRVSAVRLHSNHLKNISASPAGGSPMATGLQATVGPASGRGHR
jgi:hypothetical protein